MNPLLPPLPFYSAQSLRALLVAGTALLAGCAATSMKLVTVRSEVEPTYAAQRADRGPAAPETFVFSKGRLLNGAGDYADLEKIDFPIVARTFAADLVRAGYRPADSRSADLVVVVHWGVTAGAERDAALFAYEPDNLRQAQETVEQAKAQATADAGSVNSIQSSGAVSAAEAALRAEASHAASLFGATDFQSTANADLLGFRTVLNANLDSPAPSAAAETLRDMVNEERYFAILVAYDGRAARSGQRRRLWTTRMSIGATGQSFTTGLDRMSHTAAASHGLPQVGILIAAASDRPAPLAVPAASVIGPIAPAKPPPAMPASPR